MLGSSPHARGTLDLRHAIVKTQGIIPACAGNTPRSRPTVVVCRDHPRMRGEHPLLRAVHIPIQGSSPHARGTHDGRIAGRYRDGIIPACAGNTSVGGFTIRGFGDHPRMRGEHHVGERVHEGRAGSSPHARGTHSSFLRCLKGLGIIPACAGNTEPLYLRRPDVSDHPRMRGEHPEFP